MPLDLDRFDRAEKERAAEAACQAGENHEAEQLLRELILSDPLRSEYFLRWSQLKERMGLSYEAELARKRHQQLCQIEDNTEVSAAADRLHAIWSHADEAASSVTLHGFTFAGFREHRFKQSGLRVAPSLCGRAWIKICDDPAVFPAFEAEAGFFRALTEADCVSAAHLLSAGALASPENGSSAGGSRYQILTYKRADRGGFGFPDLVLALLEQQAAGVYNGALTIRNLRYDAIDRICRFANYEDAVYLSDAERALPPRDFIDWCAQRERERTAAGGAASFFLSGLRSHDWIWEAGRLRLRATQFLLDIRRARVPEACLQRVDTAKLTLPIGLDCRPRLEALSRLELPGNCRILEVGSGLGRISRELAAAGHQLTGIDNDRQQVMAAQLISLTEGSRIDYREFDPDHEDLEEVWDVVLLMNVFQHFAQPEQASRRIGAACRHRIYLEAGLEARGYKWEGLWYRRRSAWAFKSEAELRKYFGGCFPDFAFAGEGVVTEDGRKIYCLERKGRR
ncbi:MAG: class I SAM-dependent methyltransferase [Opitutales bacterium]